MAEEKAEFHVRPRFREVVAMPVEAVEDHIKQALKQPGSACTGSVIPGHATLMVPEAERHYWSPQLQLSFEPAEEGTLIRGLFGPHPQVWTLFVLFYSIIGFAVLVILVLGMSYMTMGKPAHILWGALVLILLFCSLYLVAYFGQKKGRNQIEVLYSFFTSAIRDPSIPVVR